MPDYSQPFGYEATHRGWKCYVLWYSVNGEYVTFIDHRGVIVQTHACYVLEGERIA